MNMVNLAVTIGKRNTRNLLIHGPGNVIHMLPSNFVNIEIQSVEISMMPPSAGTTASILTKNLLQDF